MCLCMVCMCMCMCMCCAAGEAAFPTLYLSLFLLYSLCFTIWCWLVGCSSQAKHSNFMHYMMGALMALKCLSLLSESIRFHYIALTGESCTDCAALH